VTCWLDCAWAKGATKTVPTSSAAAPSNLARLNIVIPYLVVATQSNPNEPAYFTA